MRRLLKGLGWGVGALVGALALAVGLLFAVNATDQPLSEEAQAALRQPPLPAPSERNAYIDFLALGAPAGAPTFETGVAQLAALNKQSDIKLLSIDFARPLRRCRYGDYLACVSAEPALKEEVASRAVFFARYRAMRAKPEFADLQQPTSPEDPLPAYLGMTTGHRLSLLHAAIEFNAGRRAAALAELEADFAFYRVVAAGSNTLIAKMIAFAMLDGDAMFAAELARHLPARDRAQWKRLQATLRAPTKTELDVVPVLERERAMTARWMSTRQYVRMSDATYEAIRSWQPEFKRPWWNRVAPWLYRPHYSVNKYVAQSRIMQSVAEHPGNEFFAAQREARSRARELDGPFWRMLLLSPARNFQEFFGGYDSSDYIGRAHATAGVQALAGLQARLRAAGIIKPAEIERALAGPLGRAHPNPFTGKPMDFDREKMTLGFDCPMELVTGSARGAIFADGKVSLPL